MTIALVQSENLKPPIIQSVLGSQIPLLILLLFFRYVCMEVVLDLVTGGIFVISII